MSSRSAAVLLLAVALTGCTLVLQGTSQEVKFTSEPPGAAFSAGGQTGTTPVTLDLPKGDYDIVFHRQGYEESSVALRRKVSTYFYFSLIGGVITSAVDLISGAWKEFEQTEVHVVLRPLPQTSPEIGVLISSEPSEADILIGGALNGRTPKNLWLTWGASEVQKEIVIHREGYRSLKLAVLRTDRTLKAVLEAETIKAMLRVRSKPEGAEVQVEGKFKGNAPVSVEIEWKPGDAPKRVELSKEGYRTEERRVTLNDRDVEVDLVEKLEEIPVTVKVHPSGAILEVDGVAVGEAPRPVSFSWSPSRSAHWLTVSHPGYRTESRQVEPRDMRGPIEIRLMPVLPASP